MNGNSGLYEQPRLFLPQADVWETLDLSTQQQLVEHLAKLLCQVLRSVTEQPQPLVTKGDPP